MRRTSVKLSIIIVNYNVRDFLEQALISLERALADIEAEIIVVDNASFDGSGQMLIQRFPDVRLIKNEKNVGFSAANNQALRVAKGEYIVLLNPDTVVQEDTFTKLLDFFEQYPDASAATCKILNPDGTFSVDCRHSIPTPSTAFWKLIGLNRVFPKSRIFGRYNLTYLDENEINRVEGISGSFMMIKRAMVEKVGMLDERFFMYCEDIDYCHRINQADGQIYYVPTSQIIHYKGESTKKNNLDYIITFNKSLYLFYRKHYKQKYIYPFEWLILLGVIFRGSMIFFRNLFRQYFPFIMDMVFLNGLMAVSFYIRYEMKGGFELDAFLSEHIIVNGLTSVTYFFASLFFDSLNKYRYSISKIIKANLTTFIIISALTFFFKQFAFSRLVVISTAVTATLLMVFWRLALGYYSRKNSTLFGKEMFLKRTLIVGYDEETEKLVQMLERRPKSGIEISGVVAIEPEHIGKYMNNFEVIGSLDQLPDLLRTSKTNLVIFSTQNLSYERILNTMAAVQNPNIEFKMVPGHLEFMIGKSTIERLDSLPLLEIEYAYGKPFNRFVKRSFDLLLSVLLLVPLLPFYLIGLPLFFRKIQRKTIGHSRDRRREQDITWYPRPGFIRFVLLLLEIFRGRLSFVGAPLDERSGSAMIPFEYKPGITGIVQVNDPSGTDHDARESLSVYYLKNQNIFLDVQILFKALSRFLSK